MSAKIFASFIDPFNRRYVPEFARIRHVETMAGRKKRNKQKRSCVGAHAYIFVFVYTCVQVRGAQAKREQKAAGVLRGPVGQMFKQTSNYLNSICDLRGVPAPRKYRPFSPSLRSLLRLSSVLVRSPARSSPSLFFSFLETPPKMSSA